jgi:hypothetical protein
LLLLLQILLPLLPVLSLPLGLQHLLLYLINFFLISYSIYVSMYLVSIFLSF